MDQLRALFALFPEVLHVGRRDQGRRDQENACRLTVQL